MAPPPKDVDMSIVGAFISTLLFGCYLSVAVQCTQLLYYRYKAKRMHTYLVVTHTILFLLICIRCIAVLERTVNGIINRGPDGVINTGSLNSSQSLLVNITWMLCIIVSDLFIVYRAYIVTKKKLLVILFPAALMLALFGAGIWFVISLAQITDDSTFFSSQLATAGKLFCSLTVATNLACSGLIAWYIVTVKKGVAGLSVQNDTLTSVVATIIESAAIWTAVSLAIVVTTFLGSYVNFILVDMCAPIIGIVFSIIIIRISRGQSHGDTNESNTHTTTRRDWSGRVADPDTSTNVQIRLDRIVHTHHEPEAFTTSTKAGIQDTSSLETPSMYNKP